MSKRIEMRRQFEAAEAREQAGIEPVETVAKAAAVKKKRAASTTPKKPSKSAASKEIRKKLYWGVFNQSLKRVALFEYAEKPAAQARAEELSVSSKTPHFVQPVKEDIRDSE